MGDKTQTYDYSTAGLGENKDLSNSWQGLFGGIGVDGTYEYGGKTYKNDSAWWNPFSTDTQIKMGPEGNNYGIVKDNGGGFDLMSMFSTNTKGAGKTSTGGGFLGGLGNIVGIGSDLFGMYNANQALKMAKANSVEDGKRYEYAKGLAADDRAKFDAQSKKITDLYNA